MAVEQAQQWLADPAGRHHFRLHSDGRPTEWVSDGESIAMDPLTPSGAGGEVGAGEASTVSTVRAGSTTAGSASNSQPSATAAATATATAAAVRPAGWYRNASNPEEVRYWDGSQWAADPTAATAPTDDGTVDTPGRHSIRDNGSATHPPVVGPSSVPPSGADGNGGEAEAEAEAAPALNPVAPAPVPPPAPAAPAAASAGAPAPGAAPAIAADWYPDPSSRTRLRYWDGSGWTGHVLDELPAARPPAAS